MRRSAKSIGGLRIITRELINNRAVNEYYKSPRAQTAILGITLLVSGGIAIPVSYWRSDLPGVYASAAAWTICFFSGVLALWLIQRFNGPNAVVHQVVSSTLARTSIPLAACLVVHVYGGTLADAGFVYYILAFYLITLAVETMLATARLAATPTESQTD